MVSVTQTLTLMFGSAVTVPGTGVLLNDSMNLFDPQPGAANEIQPGKRPASSMAHVIAVRDGAPVLAVGDTLARASDRLQSQVLAGPAVGGGIALVNFDFAPQTNRTLVLINSTVYGNRAVGGEFGRADRAAVRAAEARAAPVRARRHHVDGRHGHRRVAG